MSYTGKPVDRAMVAMAESNVRAITTKTLGDLWLQAIDRAILSPTWAAIRDVYAIELDRRESNGDRMAQW